MLASMFGAIAIRNNKGGATEIRFEGAPPKDLRLTDMQGRLLPAAWRDTVLSLPPIAQFTLSDLNQAVDVARVQGVEYQFHDDSVAGLEGVFEEAGATFLTFNTTKRRVSVLGDGHPISGMLNGRHYKLNGIAQRLVVIADGEVVHIERVSSVRFYERAGAP